MKKLIFLCLFLVGCNNGGSGGSASSNGATVIAAAPAATVASDGKIQLSWTASTGSPDGYYVEQSTDGSHFTRVQTVSATSALITGATRQQVYYFRVEAYNSGGNSPYSAMASVTP